MTGGNSNASESPADFDSLEIAPAFERQAVEGWVPCLADDNDVREALEKAFDYRGDVTVTRKDSTQVEGYVFDRRRGTSLSESFVRLIPKNSGQKISISYADIAALAFTGRDTAAGKSWEAWVRKYWQRRAAGESGIALEPESLDS